MAEHSAHNRDPGFNAFLQKARELQPESPSVLGGDVIFERGMRMDDKHELILLTGDPVPSAEAELVETALSPMAATVFL